MADWRVFETSVATFLQALDPNSKVTHNANLPDRDTGRSRQRDVWIETSYGGHIKFNILVSCKKYRRRVSVQDMDAFLGELSSSGAAVGVLYSYSGFSPAALEKARARGVSCCSLYENEPAHIPGSIIYDSYFYRANFQMSYRATNLIDRAELLRLMRMRREVDGKLVGAIPQLAAHYDEYVTGAVAKGKGYIFDRAAQISVSIHNVPTAGTFTAILAITWDVFRARQEAFLVSGSYNFTDSSFAGEITGPAINMVNATPDAGWELLSWPLPPFSGGPHPIAIIATAEDMQKTIEEGLNEIGELPTA